MADQENIPYHERRRLFIEAGRPLPEKKKYQIPKKSAKRLAKEKEQQEEKGESGLDKYFDYWTKNAAPVCDNCGMRADWLLEKQEDEKKQKMYDLMWRACQAHVLKKKDGIGGFPSIATNLTNHLVLFPRWGGYLCGCHDQFDSTYEEMAKMAVFPKAIDIINQLFPMIAKEERKYLPEVIIQEMKPEIYNSI